MENNKPNSEIIIYQGDGDEPKIEVRLTGETVWLSQQQLAELYQSSRTNIVEHIKHIYEDGELDELATCRNFRQVRVEGKREVERELPFYNLDMIISLGYRVKSSIATKFRIWATARLKEYIIKGFTIDSDRLKNLGGGNYWKELLDEIRDIRSSEKVLHRQVLDLYATAIDYDPQASESLKFFKIVQNKLHFAAHGHTAAEVIYLRVDSDKEFAGLTNFKGKQPTQAEAIVAKNFLELNELKVLNNLVSAYFDLAEINAIEQKPMKMADYIRELDNILKSTGRKILNDSGKISHEKATEKANLEYRKYKAKNLSEVEKSYLEAIKIVGKKIEKKAKEKSSRSKK
ncbi:virulence RhuM family protein [Candidatus Parcubacteria bacterium]|nr:virulence RhuM family protein [Patescibacteria group bacterium]MBU4309224.1 virulence RhuM family protein [Patescibacteria group bacterium]MBU4432123.1 virulence RhuM family protein [Patescibacteria group bacterium]MBU4577585.1 virulence RhuM family protein [Patescibacteria group bacterium]MCG2697272.1 virulence RhuM family protein [Candidatus Parcubacteria bacterium]